MEENTHAEHKPTISKKRLNKWKISSFVLGLFLVFALTSGGSPSFSGSTSEEEVGQTALDFINNGLLQGQATATLNEVTTEKGLFKLLVTVQGQETPIYLTKDASLMFINAIPMAEVTGATTTDTQNTQPQASPEVPSSDLPEVEVFVMSHCPYGTQMMKGMLPVARLLEDKADITFKYVFTIIINPRFNTWIVIT